MEILTKLLTFSALISICLALTIPKPILVRLCETARLARKFDLNNDVVIASMNAILSNYIHKNGLTSRTSRTCATIMTIDNDGVIQVGVLLELLALMSNSLQPLRHNNSTLESPVNYPAVSSILSALNSSVQQNFTDDFLDNFYNLFKPQSNATIDLNSFVSGSDLVSNATSKVVSSLMPDYCENIDFPESVDIENKIEVQKAAVKIISSMLKPHEKSNPLLKYN
uniref:Uncharacterized protein n=1 Tax=Tetranychus urticae TaxID=32264 RepID=T1KZP4_TETUR